MGHQSYVWIESSLSSDYSFITFESWSLKCIALLPVSITSYWFIGSATLFHVKYFKTLIHVISLLPITIYVIWKFCCDLSKNSYFVKLIMNYLGQESVDEVRFSHNQTISIWYIGCLLLVPNINRFNQIKCIM